MKTVVGYVTIVNTHVKLVSTPTIVHLAELELDTYLTMIVLTHAQKENGQIPLMNVLLAMLLA